MTVQAVDKRVIPEANMTSAGQSSQGSVSAEDAFLSVLQQATGRFANKAAGTVGRLSGDKMLADHVSRIKVDTKSDTRDDAADQGRPAVKDDKGAAKTDKKARTADDSKSTRHADDKKVAAPANDDDGRPVQVADDRPAPKAEVSDDKAVGADQVEAKATADQDEQVIVAVEVTVTETVTVVQTQTTDEIPAEELTALAQTIQAKAADTQNTDKGQDLLAGLSDDDRKRITDLENRLVNDVQQGDMDDALDAATQLVERLVAKVGEHKAAAKAGEAVTGDNLVDEQARDLASMLTGTGANLEVKVQTKVDNGPMPLQSSTMVDAMTAVDMDAQGAALQNSGRDAQSGQSFAASTETPAAVDPAQVQTQTAAGDAVETMGQSFAAVLAAQAEASTAIDDAAPEQRGVTGLASVGAAQAADKSAGAQSAQSAARTPRTLVQQQQVMEQVSVQIDKQVKDGVDTVKIQLKPVELGKIEIKLDVAADGRVTATVTADKPETLAMLQKDAKGLEKALEDAGLKPDSSATSFSLKGGEQQQNAEGGNTNTRSRRGRSGRRSTGEDLTGASGVAAQAARARSLGGRSGVDISV